MRSRVLLAVLLIASSASAASAQTSGGSRPMSATVITTWVAHDGELALLVLWRGSPGWYSRGGTGNSSSGGGSSVGGRQVGSFSLTYGGRTFTVDLDYTARTAQVLGQTISLDATNVLLVDDVDASRGARIVGRDRVDPALPKPPSGTTMTLADDPVITSIRRSPGAGAFLQCGVPLPLPDAPRSAQLDAAARARITEYMQGAMTLTCEAATAP